MSRHNVHILVLPVLQEDTVINFDIVVKNTKTITHLVSKLNQKDFKSIIARNDLGSI